MPVVDVHAHLYHPEYIDELGRLFEHADSAAERGSAVHVLRLRDNSVAVDVDQRLELMDQLGIDVQVLSLSIPMSYDGDAALRFRLARLTNDYFAEVAARHPRRFFGVAALPLPDIDASLKELARCFDELGFAGAGLGSNIRGVRLDHPDLAPVFEELDRRGAVIFLHPNTPVCAGPDLEDFNLASGLGYIFDTGVTVYRMIFSGMLERYRRLRLIVPHLGGMLPFNAGRIQGNYRGQIADTLPREPLAYMRELYYDTVSFHPPALTLVRDMFGPEHIMLGSDYPLGSGSLDRALSFVREAALDVRERERILGKNAVELLGLPL